MLWILGTMLVLSALIVKVFSQGGVAGVSNLSRHLFVANEEAAGDSKREKSPASNALKRVLLVNPSPAGEVDDDAASNLSSNSSSDSSNADDEAQKVFDTLSSQCLAIPIKAQNVRFLPNPDVFFARLQDHISSAEYNITISALYVGSGPLAKQFVQTLVERLEEKPQLRLTFLLDYNRMLHSCNLQTIAELVTEFPDRVSVSLFQAPSALMRFIPYSRAREVLGVQHTKIFCFDGVKTMLTGANLSDDYFTTRIDRYMEVKDSPELAEFYTALVQSLANISHLLGSTTDHFVETGGDQTLEKRKVKNIHKKSKLCIWENSCGADPSGDKDRYCELARDELKTFVQSATTKNEFYARRMANNNKEATQGGAKTAGGGGGKTHKTSVRSDTYIFPTLQFGRIGMYHDSAVVGSLLSGLSGNSRVYLSSPYLNIYNQFLGAMVHSKVQTHFHLITSSTQTNGWKGQKGFAGFIPQLYLQAERTLHYLMQSFGAGDRVWIHEFSLKGKTFHSKGLWVSPRKEATQPSVFSPVKKSPPQGFLSAVFGFTKASLGATKTEEEQQDTLGDARRRDQDGGLTKTSSASSLCSGAGPEPPNAAEPPVCTAIGSTNYGYRSVDKDIESEVFLLSTNADLQSRMQDELETLFDSTTVVTEDRFCNGADGRFQPVVSLVAQLGQGYM